MGDPAGWLVWHYADGQTQSVPFIYGKTTARFWADSNQARAEPGFPRPVWRQHETAAQTGKERWLRLYQQDWINPRPTALVTAVDFISNRNSPAAPFLIAVDLRP